MKYYCVDRFEGEYAVCEGENGEFEHFPRAVLPDELQESQWFSQDDSGTFRIEPEKTQQQKEKNRALLDRLFQKDQEN